MKNTLDYQFGDVDLLRQALTHRSAPGESNERLEFLGDAVLDTVISEVVFRAQSNSPEGDLSRLRSSLVKDSSLAALAADLGLGELLILGSGEKKTGGHRRESILADALEALIGAVYLDSGFEASHRIIDKIFGERLVDLPDPKDLRDPKTRLQEWLQARQAPLPVYELVSTSGRAHKQTFEVRCTVDGMDQFADGIGSSRRQAEQRSARALLKILKGQPNA
ncbi:MAG: ribonuclease III [Woeseiaceae bacterium]|nr:ribonuclease III [Woeseiaceae bacterium]